MPKIIENLKETILLEGKSQLLEFGYKNLNIRNITAACGIGTGTFYNYFKNKDMLVLSIFESDWNSICNSTHEFLYTEQSFREKLFLIYSYIGKLSKSYIAVLAEMSLYSVHIYNILTPIYSLLEELIAFHRIKGDISSQLSNKKLSKLITSNLLYLCSATNLSFDDLFDFINI